MHGNRKIVLTSDLKPDSHIYLDLLNCDYFSENCDYFNEKLTKSIPNNFDYLSFFRVNIQRLSGYFECMTNSLTSVNRKFLIIYISKTWICNLEHNADGYNFVHNHNNNNNTSVLYSAKSTVCSKALYDIWLICSSTWPSGRHTKRATGCRYRANTWPRSTSSLARYRRYICWGTKTGESVEKPLR